jgi:hypothetical protein
MSLIPFVVIWAVLATVVLVLAIQRMRIAGRSDELLHVQEAEDPLVYQQEEVAKKLEVVDRWGKILTIIVAATGLLLAVAFLYDSWLRSSSIGV